MAKRRMGKSKRRPRRKMRRQQRASASIRRATRIPVRKVMTYSSSSGTSHRWLYEVTFSKLVENYKKVFAEMRVLSVTIRYIPNNSTADVGLYVSVMADKSGFGGYGAASATSWFPTLCAYPGSIVRPRYIGCRHYWRPTEPSEREWISVDKDMDICTVYTCSNGKENEELGGMLLLDAVLLGRGVYYDAANAALEVVTPCDNVVEVHREEDFQMC